MALETAMRSYKDRLALKGRIMITLFGLSPSTRQTLISSSLVLRELDF